MNGIVDVLLIMIVTIIIGGVLVLMLKALEHCFGRYFQITFYYRFLCTILLLYAVPVLFLLFRLCYQIGVRPVATLFGVATPAMSIVFLLLAIVWVIGIIVHIKEQIDGMKFLRSIYQNRVPASCYYQDMLDDVRKEMGIRRHISVYHSYQARTAFISGLLRPAIYLPADVEQIGEFNLRILFMHELKHYKQGDILIKMIGVIIRVVYWFWKPISYVFEEYSIYAEANNDRFCLEKMGDGKKYYYMLLEFADLSKKDTNMIISTWSEGKDEIVRRLTLVNTYKAKKTKVSLAALFVAITLAVCSTTAYGATSAIQYGYNQVWNGTMVGEQEELIPVPELEEYEGTIADFEGLTLVEEVEQEVTARTGEHFFTCSLMNQGYYRSSAISKSKGGTIRVAIDVTPANKEVTVGIIKPDKTTTYVKGQGAIAHTFSIPTTGTYQLFISNYSGVKVSIAGYYK